jgi:hypothetical protein
MSRLPKLAAYGVLAYFIVDLSGLQIRALLGSWILANFLIENGARKTDTDAGWPKTASRAGSGSNKKGGTISAVVSEAGIKLDTYFIGFNWV